MKNLKSVNSDESKEWLQNKQTKKKKVDEKIKKRCLKIHHNKY